MQMVPGIPISKRGEMEQTVLRAGILQTKSGNMGLLDGPLANEMYLYIEVRPGVVSFSDRSDPHFAISKPWIGADGAGLLWQVGSRRSPFKQQLFCLQPGESILFFDALNEVTKLTVCPGQVEPWVERATTSEVADYFLQEAVSRGYATSTLIWCFRALVELDCERQLTSFRQQYSTFAVERNAALP